MALRRLTGRHDLIGVFINQFIKRELTGLGNVNRPCGGIRVIGKNPRHFCRRLEMTLRISGQLKPGLMDRTLEANAA